MPFVYAMNQLEDGQATKRPAWRGGYVKKVPVTDSEGAVTGYRYIYVTAGGDQYVFVYTIATGAMAYSGKIAHGSDGALGTGNPDSSTTLVMDPELQMAMMSDDWMIGSVAAFENARVGTGTW